MKSLKTEQSILKADTEAMKEKHHRLCSSVSQLEMEVDRINRATLTKNAVVLGVPMKQDENVEMIVQKLAVVLGYELPEGAIV